MVKAYLKYVFRKSFGAITTGNSNVLVTNKTNQIITGSNQYVNIINMKSGQVDKVLYDEQKNESVTFLKLGKDSNNIQNILAVGYEDGDVILWNLNTYEQITNLNGHKAAVTSMDFDYNNSRLITGSADNTLIVWDIIGEQALFQLNGHKNGITQVMYYELESEFSVQQLILSSSKDGLFKVWDIKLASAIETISSQNNEIWSFVFCKETSTILLGTSSDSLVALELKSYRDENTNLPRVCKQIGIIKKNSYARPLEMILNEKLGLLFILTSEKTIEVFKVLNEEQYDKKNKRKLKRMKEKGQEIIPEELENNKNYTLDRYQYNTTFHMQKKLRSMILNPRTKNNLIVSYHNNNVDIVSFKENEETSYFEQQQKATFEKLAHRTPVRALHISDNDQLAISGSGEGLKIWDIESLQTIKNIDSGKYVTCVQFLPKNRYFLAGDKQGGLELYDLNNSQKIQDIQAHEASIWSIHQHPNPTGFEGYTIVTGSADRKVKFWELAINEQKQIGLVEAKTLYMTDDVHQVMFSPDGEYYAVSLLDFSIKIYYCDTDKQFLSLYGHKLPALSIDISTDNQLLISGSADKNVKIWGMDFGNCKKSIFAHSDSIMQVKFVQNTHYFFSSSRDKTIKYWDGDTYQLVMEFNQCLGEVWSLAVSSIGDYFIAGGNDRCLRIWKQTQEQTFVQLEEEERMEKMMIEDYASDKLKAENEEEKKNINQTGLEATTVVKKKFENLKYGEEIMAAIDLSEEVRQEYMQYELELIEYQQKKEKLEKQLEQQKKKSKGNKKEDESNVNQGNNLQPPQQPDLSKIDNLTIPEFVMNQIMLIKTTELENSLKFLHLPYIEKLLYYINFYVQNNINIELASRVLFFILQNHQNFIMNSQKLVQLLISIQQHLKGNLQKQKDSIGFNILGIQTIKREIKNNNIDDILDDDIFQKRAELV
ncbi:WD40-repeat-containing domain [Pseudocohnilembus persalinus]|uniref:WD40-repeat-containing domain n=1 Tax=Pseudocohnilembus persalinus TaxID=266149 RepID=A0A0V0QYK4_PSEPJ|nr:WD40-repeat-containing domain [Pseudocohnilembus persalinus]|eukprot:KRX07433.1 WD40-repeat-containing domain [Pseudocohnilembus persalinus]